MRPTLPLLAIVAALPVHAQEPFLLDEIVLSAGITPIAADAYARAHTVLTAQKIEDRGIATLQDALRAVPGVAVSSTGSSFTQVRIRGGEANHTLILIDGIEAAGGADEYILTGLRDCEYRADRGSARPAIRPLRLERVGGGDQYHHPQGRTGSFLWRQRRGREWRRRVA